MVSFSKPWSNPPYPGPWLTTPAIGDIWPELLGALFQLSQAPEPEKRENAFRVFATTPAIIEKQHEEAVLQAFQKGFKDEAVMVQHPSRGADFSVPHCISWLC